MSWKQPFNYTALLSGLTPYTTRVKRGSRFVQRYYVDPEDPWFHYCATCKKAGGAIEDVSMLIEKDMSNWFSYQQSQGWMPEPIKPTSND